MIENVILRKNRRGERALVFGLSFPSTELIELAATAGFEAIQLDGEHGSFSPEAVDLMCRVAHGLGLTVIARPPNLASSTLNLWLDRGVQVIIGPHVESADEARSLVDACLYPPDGQRSWGAGRATAYGDRARLEAQCGGLLEFARWANANMIVFAQIESRRGHDHLEDILAVPNLHGVVGGPFDLAGSLGHPGKPDHPDVVALERRLAERGRAVGKTYFFDLISRTGIEELMRGAARDFARGHASASAASRVPSLPAPVGA